MGVRMDGEKAADTRAPAWSSEHLADGVKEDRDRPALPDRRHRARDESAARIELNEVGRVSLR